MTRRIAGIGLGLLLMVSIASTASAQRVEAGFGIGYTASEGVTSDARPLLGQVYDSLEVESGASFHFNFGVFFNDHMQGEFLFARQNSRLLAEGPSASLDVSELAVYNYHFNFVYNWGERDAKVRPYAFGGLGATNYSFGANLISGSTGDLPGETRFSSTWGGGVKFYFSPSVGAKVGLRWTPTYISSESAGVWCDPFYGCWPLSTAQYSNQFDTSVGLTVRFE